MNTLIKWCFLLLMGFASNLHAQFECVDVLYISLDPSGQYTLFPEDLLSEGDLTGFTTTLSQSDFDCSDLGPNTVSLQIFENGSEVFSCTSTVIVEDKINPVVQCFTNLQVELDENGNYAFTFEDLDAGSYDVCGTLSYVISPSAISCASVNPVQVSLTVYDGSGNFNTCQLLVTWESFPDPTPALACNGLVYVTLAFGEEAIITSDMILEGGPYGCPFEYGVVISENNVDRPQPIVTLDDTNKVLIATVVDFNTGNTCWGELIVIAAAGCDPVFEICDTGCRSTPVGDCNSGHTADDNVEWPCDVIIMGDCESYGINFSPEYMIAEGLAAPEDASPEIIDEACYQTSTFYDDEMFLSPDVKQIERTWVIIYWSTGQVWEYTQNILVMHEGIEICDTLPWNTPLGDCASGHTDSDDVEWPADITINTNCFYPEDLAMNPEVNEFDVKPTIYSDCDDIAPTYLDEITVLNDSTFLVERTWELFAVNTNQIWTFVQTITVNADTESSLVCAIREGGDAIPDVELIPGVITDDTGCYSFENPEGIVVTPVKDSPLEAGVTLLDKILLMEHVLGFRTLSPYQFYAADLSQNGVLSTLDVAYLDKILDGTFDPPFEHNWKFFNRATQEPSADISNPLQPYKFIGVKMGDIDNSFSFTPPQPLQEIILTINDEILNKKEEYLVPFYLAENKRILGFTAQIRNEENNIDFLNVTAPELPGFDMQSHVTISPGLITINYVVPPDHLQSGLAVIGGTPLFNIQLKPQDNAILSESITLESSHANLLKPSNDEAALALAFGWENVIISSVLNPGQTHQLQFYPNPVADQIHFLGFEAADKGVIRIVDALGRNHFTTPLSTSIDLSLLEKGMYYLSVSLENGEHYTAPLFKIKS